LVQRVDPGDDVSPRIQPPWLVFLKGPIAVTDVARLAAPAGSWYPDPSRRFEQRYYDGTRWTEHVSTAGVAGTDRPET